jgi:hypothetical protein
MRYAVVLVPTAIIAVSACASRADFKTSTSAATGIAADQITVGEVSGSAMSYYSWRASTPRGDYDCNTDYLRRYTTCTPVGSDRAADNDVAKAPAQ